MNREDKITEVGIDEQGRIFVQPAETDFQYIYRAAMEVHWEENMRRLHSPIPRDWTFLQWYRQILAAALDEYGVSLHLADNTAWTNIPDDLREEIEALTTRLT